ncbi:uncharacterized protein SAPINGB_P002009 [Magnusiomyces paraingens]|uniref:Cytochrome c oxidase polypeptide VIa n=1 Tax=Magnusiomyces paraingens TaxID=2606893 RepID=A0A5E8BCA3_9ASCO|nr:uncharacterized protein SAPINGB_P002009 [Saprochaete ingens]VVT48907.1 unnamed protein product [Saprochaete ingens]
MLSRAFTRRAIAPTLRRNFTSVKHGHESEVRSAFTYKPDAAAGAEFIKLEEETAHHSEATAKFWGKISLFVVVPVIAATAIHTYIIEKEHFEHLAAHPRLPDSELPPEFDYQNVRTTRFFWGNGDKTLFWNDYFNHKRESD